MKITHLTSELAPIAKVGGLGDVVSGLSKCHVAMGHDVTIILPLYDTLDKTLIASMTPIAKISVEESNTIYECRLFQGKIDSLNVIFIDCTHPKNYFQRGSIYGGVDEIPRFLFFVKSALTYLSSIDAPDVLHLHDWATGNALVFLTYLFKSLHQNIPNIVFSIHNLHHQGRATFKDLTQVGLKRIDIDQTIYLDSKNKNKVNLLSAAIQLADNIVTVSPTYAKEIQTSALGEGLDRRIAKRAKNFYGILNGLDIEYWCFNKDPHLLCRATNLELSSVIKTKQECKSKLFEQLNIKQKDPLICSITRLSYQKAPDLIFAGLKYVLENGGSYILLGTPVDEKTKQEVENLKKSFKNHPNLYIYTCFDEKLAHQVYSAADAIFIPSIFEPCGLTQMIAMRYATIPIVRSTGGLADTVFDSAKKHSKSVKYNGYSFEEPSIQEVKSTLQRALKDYREKPDYWQKLMKNCLSMQLDWTNSAKKYLQVYRNVR